MRASSEAVKIGSWKTTSILLPRADSMRIMSEYRRDDENDRREEGNYLFRRPWQERR